MTPLPSDFTPETVVKKYLMVVSQWILRQKVGSLEYEFLLEMEFLMSVANFASGEFRHGAVARVGALMLQGGQDIVSLVNFPGLYEAAEKFVQIKVNIGTEPHLKCPPGHSTFMHVATCLVYWDNVRAYLGQYNVTFKCLSGTPCESEPDEVLMRNYQEFAGIPEQGADDFRRKLHAHVKQTGRPETFERLWQGVIAAEAHTRILEDQSRANSRTMRRGQHLCSNDLPAWPAEDVSQIPSVRGEIEEDTPTPSVIITDQEK